MMIFLPKKADQKESDSIMYRDFSLRKRIETSIKAADTKVDKLIAQKKKNDDMKNKKEVVEQKLQCLEIDITAPLTDVEWRNLMGVVDET